MLQLIDGDIWRLKINEEPKGYHCYNFCTSFNRDTFIRYISRHIFNFSDNQRFNDPTDLIFEEKDQKQINLCPYSSSPITYILMVHESFYKHSCILFSCNNIYIIYLVVLLSKQEKVKECNIIVLIIFLI